MQNEPLHSAHAAGHLTHDRPSEASVHPGRHSLHASCRLFVVVFVHRRQFGRPLLHVWHVTLLLLLLPAGGEERGTEYSHWRQSEQEAPPFCSRRPGSQIVHCVALVHSRQPFAHGLHTPLAASR